VEEIYSQESTHLKDTTTHHTTAQTGPWVGIRLILICSGIPWLMGFKDYCPDVTKKYFEMHPVTMEQSQNKLITLQSVVTIPQNPVRFPVLQFSISLHYSEASNNHQFHLHPHFPKPSFSVCAPITSLCSTLLASIPEATHLNPQTPHFLPCSVNTLQSISN
jgi:hypothetical protein